MRGRWHPLRPSLMLAAEAGQELEPDATDAHLVGLKVEPWGRSFAVSFCVRGLPHKVSLGSLASALFRLGVPVVLSQTTVQMVDVWVKELKAARRPA